MKGTSRFGHFNLIPESNVADPILDGAEREAVEQPEDSTNQFLELLAACWIDGTISLKM